MAAVLNDTSTHAVMSARETKEKAAFAKYYTGTSEVADARVPKPPPPPPIKALPVLPAGHKWVSIELDQDGTDAVGTSGSSSSLQKASGVNGDGGGGESSFGCGPSDHTFVEWQAAWESCDRDSSDSLCATELEGVLQLLDPAAEASTLEQRAAEMMAQVCVYVCVTPRCVSAINRVTD